MRKLIFIAILILILAGILFIKPFTGNYKYYYLVDNLPLVSDTVNPQTAFSQISQKTSFNIITNLNEPLSSTDSFKMQSMAKLLIVTVGNKKQVAQIYKITNTENELLYCNVNAGDFTTADKLNPQECLNLQSQAFSLILHNPSNDRKILFTENSLEIFPSSTQDIDTLSSFAIIKLFPNAAQILSNAQDIQDIISQG